MACRSRSSVKSSMPMLRPKLPAVKDESLDEAAPGQGVPRRATCIANRKLCGTGRPAGTEHPGDQMDLGRRLRSAAVLSIVCWAKAGSMKVARVLKVGFARASLKARQS
ncbi:hypothetical protein Trco_000077 [Trichoderma cornu-damae]|uniref:Uncharacterized protein n=1 Tax=Trichoderma cornu-damae TaxID=654480 RepID=A0A9P8TZH4_9HYPO|nr:hypothetical protein Trco_000077 [Trichoderma cornu-damae]